MNDRLKFLEEQNKGLTERLDALEQKEEEEREAAGSLKNNPGTLSTPAVSPSPQNLVGPVGNSVGPESKDGDTVDIGEGGAMSEEGRHLEFSDRTGSAVFRFGGYMAAQLNLFSQPASQYLLNDSDSSASQKEYNGFLPRKAHVDLGAVFDKLVGATIGIESDKSTAVSIGLFHAYVYVKFDKPLVLQAGKFSNPLSLEAFQPGPESLFTEPSLVNTLVPNKDVGFMVRGKVRDLGEYWLDIANDTQDDESSATSPNKSPSNGKEITARLFATPFKGSDLDLLKGLGVGFGFAYEDATDAGVKSKTVPGENIPWTNLSTSIGGNLFLIYNPALFSAGDFIHIDPHFYYYYGPFGILGEYVVSEQTVANVGAPPVRLSNQAWLVEASGVLGGRPGYEGVDLDDNFNIERGHWGALEIKARVHEFTADVQSFTVGFPYAYAAPLATGAQIAFAYGVGVNWWFNSHFKWMVDAERTEFSGGNQALNPEQVLNARATLIF